MPNICILSRFRGGLPLAAPTKSSNCNNPHQRNMGGQLMDKPEKVKFSDLLDKEIRRGTEMKKAYLVTSEDPKGNYCVEGVATSKGEANNLVAASKMETRFERNNYHILQMDTNCVRSGFIMGWWKMEGYKK